jgi:hypothetical protein
MRLGNSLKLAPIEPLERKFSDEFVEISSRYPLDIMEI